jgi:predicted regulator of amino acid metabolism with ACT domain
MFKDLNLSCKSKVGGMCNELELDRKGRVAKTSKNRKIVNNAINFIRKETKGLKPIIFNQYEEATNQINLLSENYINFISNGKKEAGKE